MVSANKSTEDRLLKKRQAARVRQQRCRYRKRERLRLEAEAAAKRSAKNAQAQPLQSPSMPPPNIAAVVSFESKHQCPTVPPSRIYHAHRTILETGSSPLYSSPPCTPRSFAPPPPPHLSVSWFHENRCIASVSPSSPPAALPSHESPGGTSKKRRLLSRYSQEQKICLHSPKRSSPPKKVTARGLADTMEERVAVDAILSLAGGVTSCTSPPKTRKVRIHDLPRPVCDAERSAFTRYHPGILRASTPEYLHYYHHSSSGYPKIDRTGRAERMCAKRSEEPWFYMYSGGQPCGNVGKRVQTQLNIGLDM